MSNTATGQKVFGSGYFFGVPSVANPTPTQFGATQDMSFDIKRDIKTLYGTNQLPIAIASGKLTPTGKVNMATLNGRLLNDLVINGTMTSGEAVVTIAETAAIPATPFQITVAGGATFLLDLGVTFVATKIPLVRVASAPATGQYTVSGAGVYLFAAADTLLNVKINYSSTQSALGQQVSMTNQPMGAVGAFAATMGWQFGSDKSTVQLNNCTSGGLSFATKLDDFMMPAFDFQCATDVNDVLGYMSFGQVS